MKSTGITWLPEVGDEWEIYKVAHGFSAVGSGTTPDTETPAYYEGDVPWVTTSELRETVITDTTKKVTRRALREHSALKLFPPGTLLIAMYGATIGRLGVLGTSACMNQACCALGSGTFLESRFVYYWLLGFREHVIQLASGGGQPNISQEKIRSLRIPAPPPDAQLRIASFLDGKTAAIDALIAKKERLIELLQEKRQALITQAVTKGLDPNVPMKESGVEWLGAVPAHWNVHKLGYGVRLRGGYAFKSDLFQPEGVAVVRMNNLKRGRLDLSDAARIDASYCQREVGLAAGDLLWGMSGSIGPTGSLGNFAIVQRDDLPAQLNQRIGRFEPLLDYAEVSFIKHLVQTPVFTEQILLHVTGTAQFNVSAEQVESCLVPFPPMPEQRAIASYLNGLNADLESIGAGITLLIEKLREYRQALITAAVTGKIAVSKEAT